MISQLNRNLCFCLLFVLCIKGYGQQNYICEYSDTLGIVDYNKQINEIRKVMEDKGTSKSIIEGFIQNFYPDKHSFDLIMGRTVHANNDSSFVELNYKTTQKSVELSGIASSKFVVKRGEIYKYKSSLGDYEKSIIADSSSFFLSTDVKENICGYDCTIFRSLDSSVLIWVCKALPSSINPGITVKNINGSIIRFAARNGNGLTISSMIKIDKSAIKL